MTAFQGVRILDCTQGLAGPLASMLLADFGAEVLKLEPPEGDRARTDPGYITWNRNKKRLTLDIADPGERERLNGLLAAADVAVFDLTPSRLTALGLDAETLAARHPRLIHLWTPPFGTKGRWSELPAHHSTLTGLTGSAFRQGSYADQPVWHVAQIVHHAQGVLDASAVGAALVQRGETGRGRAVTVSGLQAMSQTGCPVAHVGMPVVVQGKPLGGSPGYKLYKCGDGQWLILAALFAYFMERAVKVLGLEHVPGGPSMADAIQEKLLTAPRSHWLALFRQADVPAGPVEPREAFLGSEIIQANGLCATLDHPEHGTVRMVGVPARLHATPGEVRHAIRDATEADLAAFTAARPVPADLEPRSGPPLAGIKVLDLGSVIAGAYASAILANFGAETVKVESREGDPFRGGGFINYNRGKRGLGLDLKVPEGRALFLELARQADVVLDNYRLGVRKRLGVDYEALAAVNPRLVSCSINTFGSKGSDAHLPGFDTVMQARSGLMAGQGGDGQEPVFHAIAVNDVATAAMGAFTVIAALHARMRTGEGQDGETSLAAQGALWQSGDLTWWEGRPSMRQGGRDLLGFSAVERFYPCADGWVTLACTSPVQFEALAAALGHPDWTQRWPEGTALAEPVTGDLADEIVEALSGRRRDEVAIALMDAGVPAAPVMRGAEAHQTDYFWDNAYFDLRTHPDEGDLITSHGFASFDGVPSRFERLHPDLGADGVEVLTDYGVPMERIAELARARVIFRG
jgi:crotonobetainyl-CoA:carnitine CoA-transferase CaiB-like acyl-CoA transferase